MTPAGTAFSTLSRLATALGPLEPAREAEALAERLEARVRFGERDWEECDPWTLATYVSEEQNPRNEKGLTGVEVFVPSALLASGMCLVDTPGIGSVSVANAAATRAFVPHIDAALVVLGADPPISGEELRAEHELRGRLRELTATAERALETARQTQAAGAAAVAAKVAWLGEIRAAALGQASDPAGHGAEGD